MSFTLSPNMLLRVPAVGNEQGPDYAIDINYDLNSILDAHDHSSGRGVQITPAGMNINTALTLNNNFATQVAGITFTAQLSTPAVGTIYESGVDLFYVDGIGNNIRITQSGGIAGSPGTIGGLVPPASVTYVSGSKTFVFQSGVGVAANIDASNYIFRNITPNSTFGVTMQAPAALGSNYTLTLPLLPASTSFLTLDTSGNISPSIPTLGTLTSNNLSPTANILGSQIENATITFANILDGTITGAKIAAGTITTGNIAASTITGGNIASNVALTGQPTADGAYLVSAHTNAGTAMQILRGSVNGSGNANGGEGFSTSVLAGPVATAITFTSPFGGTPIVTVTHHGTSGAVDVNCPMIYSVSATGFTVRLWDVQGNAAGAAGPFDFIVAGVR